MRRISAKRKDMKEFDWDTPSAALTARMRMATLPDAPHVRNLFVDEKSWVPVCVVNYNIHILPGVPRIFVQLLEGLQTVFEKEGRLPSNQSIRILISTPLPESEVAEYLTELQERVRERGVKVGSYPRWGKKRNTVTLVGDDKEYIEGLVEEVVEKVQGHRVFTEGEDDSDREEAGERKGDFGKGLKEPSESEKAERKAE